MKAKPKLVINQRKCENSSATHTTTYRARPLTMSVLKTWLYAYARRDTLTFGLPFFLNPSKRKTFVKCILLESGMSFNRDFKLGLADPMKSKLLPAVFYISLVFISLSNLISFFILSDITLFSKSNLTTSFLWIPQFILLYKASRGSLHSFVLFASNMST